ncbi:MAG: response regulator [Chthoniobacteraceae bacterium]|nr:response regulator [Chthoniobacteraceae bacterium]
MSDDDLSQFSMLDLFRLETESQSEVMTAGLLALEREPTAAVQLEACMRAAHSLKGAAQIVGLTVGVTVSHAMEDCFVAAQEGRVVLAQNQINQLLHGVDLLGRIARTPDADVTQWTEEKKPEIDAFLSKLARLLEAKDEPGDLPATVLPASITEDPVEISPLTSTAKENADRVLRVTAENLNRLLGLAGESLVESRWLRPFSQSLLRLKRMQYESIRTIESLRVALLEEKLSEQAQTALNEARRSALECKQFLSDRLIDLEMFDRRSGWLARRLYDEALACRMRPFADGVQRFPRMVRDLASALGKQVRLEIVGESTQVDRDILGKLDAPLGHLLRNALDHGLETPRDRVANGKPAEGVLRLEARHSAGVLQIIIADDGCGIPLEKVRQAVIARHLTSSEAAWNLSEAELLEFLFLPGFTMKDTVTEISGRGVGLDVVQDMVKQVRGTVRVYSEPGRGARFQLQLPVTLSVVRALLADIGGQPYAFPLACIARTLKVPKKEIEMLEGRQYFNFGGNPVGLVTASQLLGGEGSRLPDDDPAVIVLGNLNGTYGLVVDRFIGERELVVQPLDPQLGKIKDISAGALMEDGSPVLIIDAEDLIRSVEKLIVGGQLSKVCTGAATADTKPRKRVLVVDDSLTVRELERKLLGSRGYEVEVAVDGMDGWNAVRTGHFDLVVTDIDMPRMDGIELVTLIKKDPNLKTLPMMVVSYKDREEDRRRGLEAGADYYLTKGSFHDETLLQAVVDLIGEANE